MKNHRRLSPILVAGLSANISLTEFAFIRAAAPDEVVGVLAAAQLIPLGDTSPGHALPDEFVWMPKGTHEITAFAADGTPWQGKVLCDEDGFRLVQARLAALLAAGHRVPLDKDHQDAEATAWVLAFRWDPALGIVVKVEWTSLGEQLLRGKVYHSFSPAFFINKKTGRVTSFPGGGHAAGGLVNAPAFGTAMPSLIAARLAGASNHKPASGGTPDTQKAMNRELLVKILAALAVTHAADATDEQLVALATKHIDRLPEAGEEGKALKAQLAELQTLGRKANDELVALRAKDQARRKADAKKAVDAAVARGAIAPKDEAIQAKWRGMIEENPDHAELLASMPGNPALERITQPGASAGVVIATDNLLPLLQQLKAKNSAAVDDRALIYARHVAPLFVKAQLPDGTNTFNNELSLLLAANSLGSLAGELITQRTLSLLKFTFPWLMKISTDFSSEAAAFNQVVKARLKSVPALSTYVPGTGYARGDAVTTDVPVTINTHKGAEIAFNANELGSTNRDLFGEQIEGCHYALGKGLVDAVLAVITVANFANESIEANADIDADTMDTLDAALAGRGVIGPRVGLFISAVFRKLGKDASIVNLATMGGMKEIITSATLPPIKNIQPYEVFNMPAPAGENLTGFAGTADSLALSTRLPNDYTAGMEGIASNGVVQVVKNPDTGISVQLVRYIDHKLAESAWRLALMWGAAKGNPASGQRLISAARA